MNVAYVPFAIGILYLLQDVINPAHLGIEWSRQDKIGTCRISSADSCVPCGGHKPGIDRLDGSQCGMDMKWNSLATILRLALQNVN
jgi:hypothetical protein